MEKLIKELNGFLGRATTKTYAGSGPEIDTQRPGFIELEYKEGDWHYRDSYAGFFRSWGQEVVRYKGKPIWTQLYGGGMEKAYISNTQFAHQTFQFLKKAMSSGEKSGMFQPRGPERFRQGDWKYTSTWDGDINTFIGSEKITYKGKTVFTHSFLGGIFIVK